MSARLLLDTHVFLWVRTDDPRLTPAVRRLIEDADVVMVSAASAWEVAIKVALGKLVVPEPMSIALADAGFEELPVTVRHTERLASLPPLHSDPFDRLLVAQALCVDLTLVTADEQVVRYGVPTVRVG